MNSAAIFVTLILANPVVDVKSVDFIGFSQDESVAAWKIHTKRTKQGSSTGKVAYRDILLNLSSREVLIDGIPVELTKLEFNLILTLIKNQNIVLDRDFLLENVWGGDEIYQDRTVNVAINRLKEKIDPDKTKDYIKTVRGVGYTLN